MDITIGVIIAVIALFSPVITTRQNNKHQLEIRKLEIESEKKDSERIYKREICERYLKAVGSISNYYTSSALKELSIGHTLLTPFVSEEKMYNFNEFLDKATNMKNEENLRNNLGSEFRYYALPAIEEILKEPIE